MNRIRTLYARRGFTLIELIMVIAIIAFISAFMMMTIPSLIGDARSKLAKSQLNKLSMTLQGYHNAFHAYPPDSGYGLPKNGGLYGTVRLYDAGSLFHYLSESKDFEGKGGFNEKEISNTTYNDPERGNSHFLVDPWNNPIGYIGVPERVLHNRDGGVDLFSVGKDKMTASDLDAAGTVSYGLGGNVAYSSVGDNNGDGIDNNAPELGAAALNGTLTKFKSPKLPGETLDDHNNWEQ